VQPECGQEQEWGADEHLHFAGQIPRDVDAHPPAPGAEVALAGRLEIVGVDQVAPPRTAATFSLHEAYELLSFTTVFTRPVVLNGGGAPLGPFPDGGVGEDHHGVNSSDSYVPMQVKEENVQPAVGLLQLLEHQIAQEASSYEEEGVHADEPVDDEPHEKGALESGADLVLIDARGFVVD